MKYVLNDHQTERLDFRLLTNDDRAAWMQFCSNPTATEFFQLFEPENPEKFCDTWFTRAFARYEANRGGMNALIERETGRLVGQCGLLIQSVHDEDLMEIGYSLIPEFWGKGYAIEAAKHCRDTAFTNGWTDSIISLVHVDNKASARVAERNGMSVAKTITWYDLPIHMYRIARSAWQA